jgi:hypothetical protein
MPGFNLRQAGFVGHLDLPNSLPKNATANNSAMMAAARRAGVRIS